MILKRSKISVICSKNICFFYNGIAMAGSNNLPMPPKAVQKLKAFAKSVLHRFST